MVSSYYLPQRERRAAALALMLAVHVALVGLWHLARQAPEPEAGERAPAIQWLRLITPKQAESPPALPPPRVAQSRRRSGGPMRSPAALPEPHVVATVEQAPPPDALAELPATALPEPGAESVLERARRDVGAVDRELRKGRHRNMISAPVVSAHMRMQKGMELAYELAPPGLFEKAKITEIIDPGGYGRRRYRVVTHGGTYCMTYESNHAPDGIDTMKKGIQPKITSCEKNEQPATEQKW